MALCAHPIEGVDGGNRAEKGEHFALLYFLRFNSKPISVGSFSIRWEHYQANVSRSDPSSCWPFLKFRIAWVCAYPSGIFYALNFSVGPVSRVLKREGEGQGEREREREREGNGNGRGREWEIFSRPVRPAQRNSNIHHENLSGKYLNLLALEIPLGWAHGLGKWRVPFYEI